MSIIKYSFNKRPESIFDGFFGSSLPDMTTTWSYPGSDVGNVPYANTYRTDEGYSIEVALPGVNKNNVDINVDGDMLVISSNLRGQKDVVLPTYLKQEFAYSEFSRTFKLPRDMRLEDVHASFKDGMLLIDVPIGGTTVGRRIEIS